MTGNPGTWIMPPLRPSVYPGEIASGYLGRVSRMNGWRKTEQALPELTAWAKRVDPSLAGAPPIKVLATVAGYDTATFIERHTLLPLTLGLGLDAVHASETVDRRRALDLVLSGGGQQSLNLCRACIEEQNGSDVGPYWRREHQIPGLHWCTTHGQQLLYSHCDDSRLESPAIYRSYLAPIPEEVFRAHWACEAIHRYVGICMQLLEFFVPLDAKEVSRTARARALELGVRAETEEGCGEPLSQFLKRHYVQSWLCSVWGTAFKPQPHIRSPKIDLIVSGGSCNLPVTAYAAVFAAMYPTADAAVEALLSRSKQVAPDRAAGRAAA